MWDRVFGSEKTDVGYSPCEVEFTEGSVTRPVKGQHNSARIEFENGDTPMETPLVAANAEASWRLVDGKLVRVFHVNRDFPYFALPYEQMGRAMAKLVARLRSECMDPETGVVDKVKMVARLRALGVEEVRAGFLAELFRNEITPEDMGLMVQRKTAEAIMTKVRDDWMTSVAAGVFGVVYGLMLAAQFPVGWVKSGWFQLVFFGAFIAAIAFSQFRKR